ncbi:MAG: trypsin-like peptidase domain-containing protein [Methanobacterium sp.]|uniref:S1C family serine protease n=1 Tax=Methanobacterium sp. TaxID=2164 RepID=UPI003D65D2C6|nr:trypsin-like peptidase domain-containing protein [Methanobacterium sp.]
MKCPECGSENPKNARFCEECGKNLPEEEIRKPGTFKATYRKNKPSSNGGIKNKVIIALVCIFVVAAFVGLYAISQNFNTTTSPQGATVFILNQVSGASEVTDTKTGAVYPITVENYSIGGGSGFIISKEGYIVTAAHVISDPKSVDYEDKIKKMDSNDLQFYVNQAAIYIFLEQTQPDLVSNISDEQLDNLTTKAMADGTVRATRYEQNIYVMGPAFPDSNETPSKVELIDMGNVDAGVDVALLKLDEIKTSLPTLSLSSEKIEVGENVRTYGYPTEQFDFYASLDEKNQTKDIWKSMLTASITKGIVSAERTWTNGTKFYQTDAAVDYGNSGGPVTDDNNKVIGVLVMGFEKQGFNFFLPSEYVIELCNKNKVSLNGGSFFNF